MATINIEELKQSIIRKIGAFQDRYFKAYGQVVIRVDRKTHLMSRDSLLLSHLRAEDFKLYDSSTGEFGKILKARPDVKAIVFACTETSALYSRDHDVLIPSLDDLAEIVGPDVKVVDSADAKTLLAALKDRRGCLIRGIGMFAACSSLDEAIAAIRILEKSTEAEVYGEKLGGVKHLPEEDRQALAARYRHRSEDTNKNDASSLIPFPPEELALRNQLIETARRLVSRDLVQGSWGNLSVRLNQHCILITPSAMPYNQMHAEDIVKLDLQFPNITRQRKPSSEYKMHMAIYMEKPECRAIIHTHSNGLSVFAAAHAGFRLPNSNVQEVIGDMTVTDRFFPGSEEMSASVLQNLKDGLGCIMAGHGSVFIGDSLESALVLADMMEEKACSLLGFHTPLVTEEEEENEQE